MGRQQPVFAGQDVSQLGIIIFFSISGYLVTGSWIGDPNLQRFFFRRSLRIFPALVTLVLLSVFVAGPLLSPLPISEYLSNERAYNYLLNIGLFIIYDLSGVFTHTPIPNTFNGSLWSLPAEFFMYIVTPICFLIFRNKSAVAFAVLTALFCITAVYLGYFYDGPRPVIYATEVRAACSMACYFTAGAMFKLIGPRIAFRLQYAVIVAAIYVGMSYANDGMLRFPVAIASRFAFAYVVIAIGRRSTPGLSKTAAYGDFSYGLYLYAFPIQQAIAEYCPQASIVTAILAAFVLALSCAIASWHLVEKRALRLRPLREGAGRLPSNARMMSAQ